MNKYDNSMVEILLVEDNPGDIRLTQETLKEAKVRNSIHIATDGVEAMEFLHHEGKYNDAPNPDLIVLDLNMPRKNGLEVLAEIKTDDKLKQIPVVILTASKNEEDILISYNQHANCFITKPIDPNQFLNVIKSIENFWLTIVKLPKIEI